MGSEKTSGGRILITLTRGPVAPTRTPRGRPFAHLPDRLRPTRRSRARHRRKAGPANVRTRVCVPATSAARRGGMRRRVRPAGSRSRSITSSTAVPTAAATGDPANVEKKCHRSANSAAMAGVVTTAPIGCPFPMGFPRVTMSGATPSWANPQNAYRPCRTRLHLVGKQSAPAARAPRRPLGDSRVARRRSRHSRRRRRRSSSAARGRGSSRAKASSTSHLPGGGSGRRASPTRRCAPPRARAPFDRAPRARAPPLPPSCRDRRAR